MRKEKSCGCITIDDDKVLLMYEKNQNFWGFPKGHVEPNETEIETAKREVEEEVGLKVSVDENKRYELKYKIGEDREKTCVLFVAKPITYDIKNQETEVLESGWFSFDEAQNLLPYQDQQEALKQAIKDIK